MIIGFTGTRDGMTKEQREMLAEIFLNMVDLVEGFHHGDCIGADSEAHDIALRTGIDRKLIVAHPCDLPGMRAYKDAGTVLESFPPLERNQHIVDVSTLLLGTPKGEHEERRSGTWSTIRYSKAQRVPTIVIYPRGGIAFTDVKGFR